MKNLTKIGLVLALILGFTSTLSAEHNVRVEKDFIKTIMNASKNHSLKKLSTKIEGKVAFGLEYTDYITDAFDDLNIKKKKKHNKNSYLGYEIEDTGFISMGSEKVNGKYQCVGLVKAVSKPMLRGISTQDWVKGRNITKRKPRKGYVIATFNSNNKYDFGHVAIVLAVHKDYIVVVDQNWADTSGGKYPKGQIYIHAIDFKGRHQTNASNYHIVRY